MKHSVILFPLFLSISFGCSHATRKGKWGKDAFRFKQNLGRILIRNAQDPHVWAPLIGAGVLAFSKQDQKISSWAAKETPLLSSNLTAKEESDEDVKFLETASYATAFLTTSWDDGAVDYAWSKTKGLVVMRLGQMASNKTTMSLKGQFRRQRPNEGSLTSMPSGHSAQASSSFLLIRRNLAHSDLNPYAEKTILFLSGGVTAATMWSRIEGQAHFPSDTLVGYSLGQFITGVVFDSLMSLDANESFGLYPSPRGDLTALYSIRF